jgi:hypothetical protein
VEERVEDVGFAVGKIYRGGVLEHFEIWGYAVDGKGFWKGAVVPQVDCKTGVAVMVVMMVVVVVVTALVGASVKDSILIRRDVEWDSGGYQSERARREERCCESELHGR